MLLAIDFQSVINYINHEVLELKQTVSMAIILIMYGLNVENIRYRSRWKTRIVNEFGDKLTFLRVHPRKPEIVSDANLAPEDIDFRNEAACIMKAVEYLRDNILSYQKRAKIIAVAPMVRRFWKGKT